MSELEEDSKLNKWLDGDLSNEDFANATSKEELLKYQQILGEVDNWTPDNKEMLFEMPEQEKEVKVMKLARWSALSVAASVALLAFCSIWYMRIVDQVQHFTAYGETKEVVLPDGVSKVILAAKSEIIWRASDWEKEKRTIKLKGKAYFDVEPGSTFNVVTKNGGVEVLGTTFDVNAYTSTLQVICYTGKVRANALDDTSQIIAAGESIRYFDGQWEDKMMITDAIPSWISSELKFSNAPLSEVLASLASEYELIFETDAIDDKRRFSGFLPKESLDSSLNILFTTLSISYEIEGNVVLLKTSN